MLPLLWLIGAAVVGTAVVVTFWDTIRDFVADAIRKAGLHQSIIMDAWIQLDRLVTSVRCRLFTRKTSGHVKTTETTLTMEEIDDEDIRKQLKTKKQAQFNVMTHIE